MKLKLILASAVFLSACSSLNISNKTTSVPLARCQWGTSEFNLCQYSTKEQMIEALIAEMTLQEKIGQMTQSIWHNNVSPQVIQDFSIGSVIHTEGPIPGPRTVDWLNKFDEFQDFALQTRLGIPLMTAVDAVHGQNTFEGAVIFPHNIGMAATRNMPLIKRAAEITAIEMAGTGFNWTFSPCIAMPFHEHWGRVYEGFSEDALLTTQAVEASIHGHQGGDLSARHTVAATAKHYIADGATTGGREGGNAVVSDKLLRETLLPPYKKAVEENIAAIMVGFNSVNNINMHQHRYLVTDVLKGELGFKGVVLTDWNGGIRFGEPHTVINAGVDIAMQPGNHEEFITKLTDSVLDGTVAMTRINDAVRRILTMKFNLGLFEDPFTKREFSIDVGSEAHREVARQAVRESLVLLKNKDDALPLKRDEAIAVVGEHAISTGLQSGGWSIHWQGQTESYAGATTILDGIRQFSSQTSFFEKGCTAETTADKAIVVVGEQPYAEFKGDTLDLDLTETHKKYIESCRALGKQVITVLISGRTLIVNDELEKSDAFIAAWLPGSEGAGVADLLFSKDGFKPKGKLPFSWPKSVDDLPLDKYDDKALFPFSYGLEDF